MAKKGYADLKKDSVIADKHWQLVDRILETAWGKTQKWETFTPLILTSPLVVQALALAALNACPIAPFIVSNLTAEYYGKDREVRLITFIERFKLHTQTTNLFLETLRTNKPVSFRRLIQPYAREKNETANSLIIDLGWIPGGEKYCFAPLIGAGRPDLFSIVRLFERAQIDLGNQNDREQFLQLIRNSGEGWEMELGLILKILQEKRLPILSILEIITNHERWQEERFTSYYQALLRLLIRRLQRQITPAQQQELRNAINVIKKRQKEIRTWI